MSVKDATKGEIKGKLIEQVNAKDIIKRNAENAHDWEWNELYVSVSNVTSRFRNEIIDPLESIDRLRMPEPVIAFEDSGNKEVLGTYTVGRNGLGIKDQITLNTVQFKTSEQGKKEFRYGVWSMFEVILHEQIHLYMHHLTEVDGKKRPAHGKEFTQKCESLGLHPVPNIGSHYQVANADSPFGRIMKELGIQRPADVPRSDDDPLPKRDYWRPTKESGRSSLELWICECTPPQRARIGKDEFFATCNICQMPFRRRTN